MAREGSRLAKRFARTFAILLAVVVGAMIYDNVKLPESFSSAERFVAPHLRTDSKSEAEISTVATSEPDRPVEEPSRPLRASKSPIATNEGAAEPITQNA